MIIKKLLLSALICISFACNILAQESSDTLTPKAGEKQISFGINTYSGGYIIYRKHKSEKSSRRLILSGYYDVQHQNGNLNNNQINRASNYSIEMGYGFQRKLGSYKKLEPYAGIDFTLTARTGYRHSIYSQTGYGSNSREEYDGLTLGFSTIPFLGFNYYITDRLAFGAEYRTYLINFSWNNKQSSKFIQYDTYGDMVINDYHESKNNIRANGSLFSGSAIITASFFLNKK